MFIKRQHEEGKDKPGLGEDIHNTYLKKKKKKTFIQKIKRNPVTQ